MIAPAATPKLTVDSEAARRASLRKRSPSSKQPAGKRQKGSDSAFLSMAITPWALPNPTPAMPKTPRPIAVPRRTLRTVSRRLVGSACSVASAATPPTCGNLSGCSAGTSMRTRCPSRRATTTLRQLRYPLALATRRYSPASTGMALPHWAIGRAVPLRKIRRPGTRCLIATSKRVRRGYNLWARRRAAPSRTGCPRRRAVAATSTN